MSSEEKKADAAPEKAQAHAAAAPAHGASAHAVSAHDGPGKLDGLALTMRMGGLAALAGGVVVGLGMGREHMLSAYVFAFCFVLTISLGGLFFVILQHLVGAKWSVVVRRVAETVTAAIPAVAILAVPIVLAILMGGFGVYDWADKDVAANDHLIHHKGPFLNKGFFVLRCIAYFGFWLWAAHTFRSRSLEQDRTGNAAISDELYATSAPSMIVFALTLTFAAFDFIMSIDAHWFSTIFGVYIFAGSTMSIMATLILVGLALKAKGMLKEEMNVEHFHDLGKLLFAFTFFWGYIAFSQYMLYWYANMPEETGWYKVRSEGTYGVLMTVLIFGHFVIPFGGLLSRHIKRNMKTLAFFAVWQLCMHAVDLYWLVTPSVLHHSHLPLPEILFLVGGVAFAGSFVARELGRVPLIPKHDPNLKAALAFENF